MVFSVFWCNFYLYSNMSAFVFIGRNVYFTSMSFDKNLSCTQTKANSRCYREIFIIILFNIIERLKQIFHNFLFNSRSSVYDARYQSKCIFIIYGIKRSQELKLDCYVFIFISIWFRKLYCIL